MRILHSLWGRLRSDDANATLTSTIISMTVICVALGFGLDFARASAFRNDQTARSQDAAESAIQFVDPGGSLYWYETEASTVPPPVVKAVSDYATRARLENVSSFRCPGTTPWYEVRVEVRRGSSKSQSRWIAKDAVDESGKADPTLFTFEGAPIDPDQRYRVLNLTVHDSVQNSFLGLINMPCVPVTTDVSATVFGSQEDL